MTLARTFSEEDECGCVVCPAHQTTEQVYRAVLDGRLTIDSKGRVWRGPRRADTHQIAGYRQVRARIDGRLRGTLAHRLVLRHVIGPFPEKLQVNHKNGDKLDNRPSNLELVTRRQNSLHAEHVLGVGRLTPEARAKGIAWGQSPAGRAWRRENRHLRV